MCFDECYSAFRDPTTFHPFCAWIVCNPGIPRIRVVDAVFAQLHSSKILPAPTSTHLRAQMAWKIMHKLPRDADQPVSWRFSLAREPECPLPSGKRPEAPASTEHRTAETGEGVRLSAKSD